MGRGPIPQVLKESELVAARKNRITLFEDQDIKWTWDEHELCEVLQMWNQEIHIYYMADYLKIKPLEAMLALEHLIGENKLPKRHFGLLEGIQGPYVKADKVKYARFRR